MDASRRHGKGLEAEQALEAPEQVPLARVDDAQRFRVLVESIKDYAIFLLDVDGRVQTWNAGAQILKGYRPEEIVGKSIEVFYTPEDRAIGLPKKLLGEALAEGRVENEGWRRRKDGSLFWADVIITALIDEEGRHTGYAKVTRDLTERRNAEEDRRRLDDERVNRARAEEAVRLRDEFLSIASHELKTPLTTLQIEMQSLRERAEVSGDARAVARFERAVRNARRLETLIESLLDVSRIATGNLALRPERFDLLASLSQLAESMRGVAARARCELSLQSDRQPVIGCWDRLRVEQVVMNLLSNAFKYGAGAPVTVTVTRDEGEAIVMVADRGPGVPEADLRRIFGRFERAASVTHYGGLGLGLYVSREIVHAMGGAIEVRNLPEGGACFTVRLPREDREVGPAPLP